MDSEAKNVGIGAKKSKAEAEKLPKKAVVDTLDTISKQIENGRGLISNLLDMPKLSLRQPPITGYMVKTAENEAFLDPTLSPENSTENIGEVNIIQDQTNIDNIECENDQYLDQILSLDGQNITKKSAQLSIDPPGRELKWKRFSDILSIVRLPNPDDKNSQSEGDPKKNVKKKRRRLKKKEEDRAQDCRNPISRYFPKIEVSRNQNGKRKCQSPNVENSKKKRC